jgi:hypothetical protein
LLAELSRYEPTAVQFPAEGQETESSEWRGPGAVVAAFVGNVAFRPVAQAPEVSVSSSPSLVGVLSLYAPTAVQFPGEAHEIELSPACGFGVHASAGKDGSIPVAQVPPLSLTIKPCEAQLSGPDIKR